MHGGAARRVHCAVVWAAAWHVVQLMPSARLKQQSFHNFENLQSEDVDSPKGV